MNCEICQELIHDLIDGSISQRDELTLNTHLKECLDCESVRRDLSSILAFSRQQRGVYEAPPNERALWLRIRNTIEAENPTRAKVDVEPRRSFFGRLMGRSWELSLPQLAASTVAIVLLVSLATVVGLRRWGGYSVPSALPEAEASNLSERFSHRRHLIEIWNQRVEQNKGRWTADMRDDFQRSLSEIDKQVADSLNDLKSNPHDEVSEQMINLLLDQKLSLLKEFADL